MMLGGLATLGLVNWFVPMDDGKSRQVIFGMAEEFLRLSIKYGYGNVNPGWKNGVYEEKATRRLDIAAVFRGYIRTLSDRTFKFRRSRAEIRCIRRRYFNS